MHSVDPPQARLMKVREHHRFIEAPACLLILAVQLILAAAIAVASLLARTSAVLLPRAGLPLTQTQAECKLVPHSRCCLYSRMISASHQGGCQMGLLRKLLEQKQSQVHQLFWRLGLSSKRSCWTY